MASEARKKQRPRSANISPQRLLSHPMPQMDGSTVIVGAQQQKEPGNTAASGSKGSKFKPRTGSVSPSSTLGR